MTLVLNVVKLTVGVNSSDCEEGLLDIENSNTNANPSLEKHHPLKLVENPQQDGSNTEGGQFKPQRKTKEK